MKGSRWPQAAVLLACFGATVAFAAGDEDRTTEAGIGFRQNVKLTPQETLSQSRDYYKKMLDVRQRVTTLVEKSRKDKDMVKLNCVSDKLTQVNGHLTVTDQSMTSLNGAISRGDAASSQHEFTRITILYQKVNTLGTEAEQCIGEDVSYVGATTVDVEIDPGIPPTDPTQPDLPLPDVQRPPEASPFV
jgi:hypothetical protein